MFGGFGLPELLLILVIVVFIFGPKRLKTIGSDLGNAIKGFRTAVTDEDKASKEEAPPVIEGQATTAEKREEKQDANA